MKEYPIEKKRILATAAHNGAGKTSLVESILFNQGAVDRLGSVDNGTAFTDFAEEEHDRQITINTAVAEITPKDHFVQILDLPGYADFVGDVRTGMGVVDSALFVVCAASGVEVETEKKWEYADEFNLPRIVFVNKMDREQADFDKVIGQLKELSDIPVVPIQIPIGAEEDLKGVVDLVSQKALYFDDKGNVTKTEDPPAELADAVEEARSALLDSAAEMDDEVCMKYLEGEPLTEQEIITGLTAGTKQGAFAPVLCGSATKMVGIAPLVDAIMNLLPSPADRGAIDAKKTKGAIAMAALSSASPTANSAPATNGEVTRAIAGSLSPRYI